MDEVCLVKARFCSFLLSDVTSCRGKLISSNNYVMRCKDPPSMPVWS